MALMDIIKARHSIRKYTDEQIKREDLEKFLKPVIMRLTQVEVREV